MRSVGADVIIFLSAAVCIAYGSLILATYTAIKDDVDTYIITSEQQKNQQPPSILQDGQSAELHSMGNDLMNYITYSYTGAIACLVVGSLQMVVLLFKYVIPSR